MSLGPVMLDIDGIELNKEDKEILQHPAVGGVILFSRNFANVEQLEKLVSDIHSVREPHLLIAVDHEGGRVQRFKDGFTHLPAARRIGELYDHNKQSARKLAEKAGWLMAVELRSVGLDFSFAPVVDIDFQCCEVIGDRSFHREPHVVYELAYAYIKGMDAAGMSAVAKHFPGHGAVSGDSHLMIPIDDRHFETIFQQDIYPYRMLIANNLAGIMPAHVIYEKSDNRPAGFSEFWLKKILRQQLGYNGLIFSDDLNMEGAGEAGANYADRAKAAFHAGCDMVLVCNNRAGAIDVVESLSGWSNPMTNTRLVRMHGRNPLSRIDLRRSEHWHQTMNLIQRYVDEPSFDLKF